MDVATGSGGDFLVSEHHVLCGTATQGSHDACLELGTRDQGLLLIRGEPGQALGLATGNQGDLLNRVVVFDQCADQGMTDFVISDQTLAATVGEGTTLHAGDDPIHSVVDLAQADGFLAAAGGEDGRLVHQVGQVCTGEARGAAGDAFEGQLLFELLVAAVHIEDGQATLDVGGVHGDLTVKTAGTHQS